MGFQSGNGIAYFFICKYINIQKHFKIFFSVIKKESKELEACIL